MFEEERVDAIASVPTESVLYSTVHQYCYMIVTGWRNRGGVLWRRGVVAGRGPRGLGTRVGVEQRLALGAKK